MDSMEHLYKRALPLVAGGASRRQLMQDLLVKSWKAQQLIVMCRAALAGQMEDAVDPKSPTFRGLLIRRLRKPVTLSHLAEDLHTTSGAVEAAIKDLEESGYAVQQKGNCWEISRTPSKSIQPIDLALQFQEEHIFGFVTDTHLCSKSERLDVLRAAYDVFADRGIVTVFHAGNMVDGEARFNTQELFAHGITDQANYVLANYPQKPGMTTYFVDGDDHEGWWTQREGIEFGRVLQMEAEASGRHDLQYMGYMENDVLVKAPNGQTIIKVIHAGGGSAYALSYTSQKLVESLQGGEKPHILLIGHYHKAEYCYPRGVHCVQGGCTQDQTKFMRKKRLEAHLGFWIIRFRTDDHGAVTHFAPEFFPFYDRQYYAKRGDIKV